MVHQPLHRTRGFSLLVCLLGLVAACGGEDDEASPSAFADEAATTGVAAATAGADAGVPASASATGEPTGDHDPCALLTVDDLTTVTGVEFGEGTFNEQLSAGGNLICDWLAVDGLDTVQVLIHPDVAAFEQTRDSAVVDVVDIDVPGADGAYILSGGIVGMAAGDVFLQVSYLASGDTSEPAAALAEIAVGRL